MVRSRESFWDNEKSENQGISSVRKKQGTFILGEGPALSVTYGRSVTKSPGAVTIMLAPSWLWGKRGSKMTCKLSPASLSPARLAPPNNYCNLCLGDSKSTRKSGNK